MKKTLLVAALIVAAAVGYQASALTGDVNGDGSVTSADITAIYDYMLTGDTTHATSCDVDGDGSITSADVTAVYSILLGN